MSLFIEKPSLKEYPPGLEKTSWQGEAGLLGIQCIAEREWQFSTMGSLISPIRTETIRNV
jgi:hypothetical protein